ncbi:MAG TPA: inositol monophosphatase family protein [Nitrososphaera sp.]|nr:inositol monophosphatase family protein [Nitrososphaera sp.]
MTIVDILKQACRQVHMKTLGLAGTARANKQMGRGAGGDMSRRIDLVAEKTVIDHLTKHKVDATVIGEECGRIEGRKGYVIMDAIDGTTNAVRGIPFYCCSIAYATDFKLSAVTDAAIIDLARGDLYYASKGRGAFVNSGKRIHARKESPPDPTIGINMSGIKPAVVERLAPIIAESDHTRQFGANALEMCFLARGFLDAYIDLRGKIRPTDIAAGYLIAKEAGAKVYSHTGSVLDSDLDVKTRLSYVVTANDGMLKQLSGLF